MLDGFHVINFDLTQLSRHLICKFQEL